MVLLIRGSYHIISVKSGNLLMMLKDWTSKRYINRGDDERGH